MRIRFQICMCLGVTLGLSNLLTAHSDRYAVIQTYTVSVTELVLLNSGTSSGLRIGSIGQISRGIVDIADIIVVATRSSCAVALISTFLTQESVKPGDSITFSSTNFFKTK